MKAEQALDPVVRQLEADGFIAQITTGPAEVVRLQIIAGDDACADCLTPPAVMRGIVEAALRDAGLELELDLVYPTISRDDPEQMSDATLSAADRVAIHELIARFNWAADTGDAEAWAATFTPEGAFDGFIGRLEGRTAIASYLARLWSLNTDPDWASARGSQHWTSNLVLEGTGEEAVGRSHLLMITPAVAGPRLIVIGHYADRFRKVGGKWLFEERRLRRWPSDEVASKLAILNA
jgi:hypothetical protein